MTENKTRNAWNSDKPTIVATPKVGKVQMYQQWVEKGNGYNMIQFDLQVLDLNQDLVSKSCPDYVTDFHDTSLLSMREVFPMPDDPDAQYIELGYAEWIMEVCYDTSKREIERSEEAGYPAIDHPTKKDSKGKPLLCVPRSYTKFLQHFATKEAAEAYAESKGMNTGKDENGNQAAPAGTSQVRQDKHAQMIQMAPVLIGGHIGEGGKFDDEAFFTQLETLFVGQDPKNDPEINDIIVQALMPK